MLLHDGTPPTERRVGECTHIDAQTQIHTRAHTRLLLSAAAEVQETRRVDAKAKGRRPPPARCFFFPFFFLSQHPGRCTARVRASRDEPRLAKVFVAQGFLLPRRNVAAHEIRNRLRSCSSTFVVFHEDSRMETRGLKKEIINFREKKSFFVCKVVLFMMPPTKKTYDCSITGWRVAVSSRWLIENVHIHSIFRCSFFYTQVSLFCFLALSAGFQSLLKKKNK